MQPCSSCAGGHRVVTTCMYRSGHFLQVGSVLAAEKPNPRLNRDDLAAKNCSAPARGREELRHDIALVNEAVLIGQCTE